MKKFWALLLALCLLGGFALGECPRFAPGGLPARGRLHLHAAAQPRADDGLHRRGGAGRRNCAFPIKDHALLLRTGGREADLLLVAPSAQEGV